MEPEVTTEVVQILLPDDRVEAAHITMYNPDPDDIMSLKLMLQRDAKEYSASSSDFFDALCFVRQELEKEGVMINCYGSSKNVYPSGMGRDMGAGLQAYKLELGRRAEMEHLVYIFDQGPDVELVSVDEQRTFYMQWLRSHGVVVPEAING